MPTTTLAIRTTRPAAGAAGAEPAHPAAPAGHTASAEPARPAAASTAAAAPAGHTASAEPTRPAAASTGATAPPGPTAPPASPAPTALPPGLLLHGFPASGEEDFAATGWPEAFAAAGRTVLVVDLPGHGSSGPVAGEEATTSAVVAALDVAIESLGESEVDVVGYSLGARLAWELPAATGRVRRLVLGGLSPFEPFAGADVEAIRRGAEGTPGAGGEPDPLTGMMAALVSAPGRDTASLLALIAGLGAEPFAPQDRVPAVPTLFVAGADDPMTQGLEALAATVPGASLLRVPGDHRGALDSAELRRAALDFLS